MAKKKLVTVHGIRPDLIRMSLILKKFFETDEFEIIFVWSGQHYSDNLKDVFFRELNVPRPTIELGAGGETDSQTVASIITKLTPVLEEIKPDAICFLGDTNTVMGCLAAAMLNIPIVHIEGCMRSYDWRMPEEKYRTTIDHLSDVIYTYFDEYKAQGVAEGLNPKNIIVVQNLIVDVLEEYYFKRKSFYDEMATNTFFSEHSVEKGEYYLMTCHRRENVHIRSSFENILKLVTATDRKIYFPASYRTQKVLKEYNLTLPNNVILVDPIGYNEMLTLMVNSRGVITDSGSVVEETAVLQIPAIQMRKATERPQVYDCGSSVKFDPSEPDLYPFNDVYQKFENLHGKTWQHNLGDGKSSQRIVDDLFQRLRNGQFNGHLPENNHLDIHRSYMGDGLSLKK
ncbi:MAG: UDP-N-acetyl glucosamine 2-epimerase [Chloroflexi bacterium]|nr:UDP-N-acetyl glucosamine 2-epimerase [Chloroflexota bacterium]